MALARPNAELRLYPFVSIATPQEALASLGLVFQHGIDKHGPFVAQDWTSEHFFKKYERHMRRYLAGTPIDESGEPHLVHAAADLLFAWECTPNKETLK